MGPVHMGRNYLWATLLRTVTNICFLVEGDDYIITFQLSTTKYISLGRKTNQKKISFEDAQRS